MEIDQTKTEFFSWLEHPLTRALKRLIEDAIDEHQRAIGRGATGNPGNSDYTHAMTHKVVGQIEGLKEAQDILSTLVDGLDEE